MTKLEEIRDRLVSVEGRKWNFNPNREMFVGTTNAVDMYDRSIDLGLTSQRWLPSSNPEVRGYVLDPESTKFNAATRTLGEFLESCREDIAWLLVELEAARK